MRFFLQRCCILFLFIGFSAILAAQDREITGLVMDESGMPLIGANIIVPSTGTGTSTDIDGKFLLKVSPKVKSLKVSYIGYSEAKIVLKKKNYYEVTLKEALVMDEVVITALGVERSEKALGYSVQKLDAEAISAVKPTNVTNALAGKVSGVYITGSSAGPTASANINIRGVASLLGNNQPLFVVNGIAGNQRPLQFR
ncbi:MAG: carboxypeptidase-like regulatory domain-containing protein [Saprospiraceae bacterium]